MQPGPTVICALAADTPARVVETATWLAQGLGGRVVLAHAFDPMGIAVPTSLELALSERTDEELVAEARGRAQDLLEQAAAVVGGVPHTTAIADGEPVQALLALAAEHPLPLLVTGTATHGTLDRILVGSISSELATRAPCPVIVVPDDAAVAGEGPVVAGYDGSDDSLRAARHGAALAAGLGRELVLVHVTDPGEEPVRADIELARELHEAISVIPPATRRRLDASVAVEHGEPAERLAAIGHERDAALLVAGTRGRGAVTAALLGSVSSGVVRRGGRPVALVGPAVVDPVAG